MSLPLGWVDLFTCLYPNPDQYLKVGLSSRGMVKKPWVSHRSSGNSDVRSFEGDQEETPAPNLHSQHKYLDSHSKVDSKSMWQMGSGNCMSNWRTRASASRWDDVRGNPTQRYESARGRLAMPGFVQISHPEVPLTGASLRKIWSEIMTRVEDLQKPRGRSMAGGLLAHNIVI